MGNARQKSNFGFTIAELVITMLIAIILALVAGALFVGGHRAWCNTYSSAHKKIKQDAQSVMLTFGSMGRKSNRKPRDLFNPDLDYGYAIYDVEGSSYSVAQPIGNAPQVVSGDAAEFIYWDSELDSEDSGQLMDATKIATAYALFYIDGDKLMLDRGPYPPGAVAVDGSNKNAEGVITTVLAENVSYNPDIGAFSYTVENGIGRGAVRIHITLTDPEDEETIKVMTATLLRNMWPR